MKKVFISSLFLFILVSSCKKNDEIQNSSIIKIEKSEIDELFALKDKITKNEQLNFISDFYALTVIDTMLNKNKTLNRIALTKVLKGLVKDGGFSGTQLNDNMLNEVLKNSKTKNELANAIYEYDVEKGLTSDGLVTYDIEKLTDNIFKIYYKDRLAMAGNDLLYKYENEEYSFITEEMLEKLVSPSLDFISKKLNCKFVRQSAKYDTYTSTNIGGSKYFTIPYYEKYNDNSGTGYQFNLLIATDGNEFYYLYDDPKTKNDDWVFEQDDSKSGFVEEGATGVPKKPNWLVIK
jgi:hypothetical protein